MIGLVLIVLLVPGSRHFYALDFPPRHAFVGALIIAGSAIAVLEAGWTWAQRRLPEADRVSRIALNPPTTTSAGA